MPIKRKNVREVIFYEYAKLVADAAVDGRPDRKPHPRDGKEYWSFVAMTFKKLITEDIAPSSLLRENKILVNDGQVCVYCGNVGSLQWEHIIPKSRGGPDTIDNLVLSCKPCNLQKSALNPIDWYKKRGLERRDIPRLVMGKVLKLVLEEHRRRGTLFDIEFPVGEGLSTSGVCRVYEVPIV